MVKTAKLSAGENVTYWTYESGTYGNPTGAGQWPGLVQNVEPNDTENVISARFHGNSSRNVAQFLPGARDNGGTMTFYPQDFRFLQFALGSGADATTGSPAYYTHTIGELEPTGNATATSGTNNPFPSFALETDQFSSGGTSLTRYYQGCNVDTYTLSASQGEPLSVAIDFIAQSKTQYWSGAQLTASDPAIRPFMWSDTALTLSGTSLIRAKSWEYALNNNMDRDGAHICNGSRVIDVPQPTERGHQLTMSFDGESTDAARLYGEFVSGGNNVVNAKLTINNIYDGGATSGASTVTFSGCAITEFAAPNAVEGINQWDLTLIPEIVTAVIQDQTEKYNAW